MILIIMLILICIATIVAIVRSDKPLKLILAEAKFELKFNAIGSKSLIEDIVMKSKNKTELEKKSGKVCVITGATRGIGAEVTKMLMKCDVHVVIGCRDLKSADALLLKIRDEDEITTGQLTAFQLDISSMESVREFAKIVTEKFNSIDYLVNNAGIMYVPYAESPEGHESQFATNYLGHFLLTHLLMNQLRNAGKPEENARIVNVSSCAHAVGSINFDDINKKDLYIAFEAYAQSKLAQLLFSNYLNKLLTSQGEHIQVHSVHPGIVNTTLFDGTLIKSSCSKILPYIFKSPEKGAVGIVHACISSYLEGKGGNYISNCRIKEMTAMAQDGDLQEKLFEFTKKLVNVEHYGT